MEYMTYILPEDYLLKPGEPAAPFDHWIGGHTTFAEKVALIRAQQNLNAREK